MKSKKLDIDGTVPKSDKKNCRNRGKNHTP
jgi:hypothetical protein